MVELEFVGRGEHFVVDFSASVRPIRFPSCMHSSEYILFCICAFSACECDVIQGRLDRHTLQTPIACPFWQELLSSRLLCRVLQFLRYTIMSEDFMSNPQIRANLDRLVELAKQEAENPPKATDLFHIPDNLPSEWQLFFNRVMAFMARRCANEPQDRYGRIQVEKRSWLVEDNSLTEFDMLQTAMRLKEKVSSYVFLRVENLGFTTFWLGKYGISKRQLRSCHRILSKVDAHFPYCRVTAQQGGL